MIIGYSYQSQENWDKIVDCFKAPSNLFTNKDEVYSTLKNLVDGFADSSKEVYTRLKNSGCDSVVIKSVVYKEEAWNEFFDDIKPNTVVIVSSYSDISDSELVQISTIKDAIDNRILIVSTDDTHLMSLDLDTSLEIVKKYVLEGLEARVLKHSKYAAYEQIASLTRQKYPVTQIMEITGASRSTVFRVRRLYGLSVRMNYA